MEEIKIKGVVIKAIDYKDSDKLVTIFSAERGLIRARVRGVKKDKAKLAFAVQPFAFVEYLMTERKGFYTVINATSIDQFFNLTADFDNYLFMLSCLEVIEKTIKENQVQPELFVLLLNALKGVCYDDAPAENVFIKFMIESMKYLGFFFTLDCCSVCGSEIKSGFYGFSYDYNGFICSKCGNKNEYLELTAGEFSVLKNINQTDISKLQNLKFNSKDDVRGIVSLIIKIFKLSTDQDIVTVKQFF